MFLERALAAAAAAAAAAEPEGRADTGEEAMVGHRERVGREALVVRVAII
jgi:hypothetical protein